MRVLEIIHTQGHGGAENTFRCLAWGLQQQGVDVVAAIPETTASEGENWIAPAIENLNIPYVKFLKAGRPLELLENIGAVIDKVKPDIVHSHLLDSNFYSSLACKRRNISHICTEHGDVSLRQTVLSRFKYGMISFCSQSIVCVSDAVKEKTREIIPIKSKLSTIYNGLIFINSCASTFREEYGIPRDGILIGNVGNLYPVKGQKFLIRAVNHAFRSYSADIYLVLVGGGVEQENLQCLVQELGIPKERVVFTGFRNDIQNIMNAIDLYIQPSLSEGHPIAVLEAMSLGIPVIATAVGGIPEIIGKNVYGTLVTPASWEDIYRGILEYLCFRDLFLKKAVAAKSYIRKNFSIETMSCNYIDTYQQLLNLRPN